MLASATKSAARDVNRNKNRRFTVYLLCETEENCFLWIFSLHDRCNSFVNNTRLMDLFIFVIIFYDSLFSWCEYFCSALYLCLILIIFLGFRGRHPAMIFIVLAGFIRSYTAAYVVRTLVL